MFPRPSIKAFVIAFAALAILGSQDARSVFVQEDTVAAAPLPAAAGRAAAMRVAQFGGFSIEIPIGPPDDDGPVYDEPDDDEAYVAPRRPKRPSCQQFVRQERDALRRGNERAAKAARTRYQRCLRGR